MSFKLSKYSEGKLQGVKPELIITVRRAIGLSKVDFRVIEGLRTRERQLKLYKSGASQTLNSKHITGDAVDLAPYVDGMVRWDWPLFYPIAEAMKMASADLGVEIRWGGCWKLLSDIEDPETAVSEYAAERKAQGKRAFMDGPHFELYGA